VLTRRMATVNARVREIVDLLVEMISADDDTLDTEISLIERLVKRGYHLREIDAALETLFSLPIRLIVLDTGVGSEVQTKRLSKRFFIPAERVALSTEAQTELIKLTECGLLTDAELEEALFQIVGSGLRDIGVTELLLLLMSIIPDEDRRALIAPELITPGITPGPN
jgi:hypothetical protein